MFKTKNAFLPKLAAVLLLVAMILPTIPILPVSLTASAEGGTPDGIDPTSTEAQYIGYGFDVTKGELKKSNLQPDTILERNSDLFTHVYVKDMSENKAGNIIAYSAQELSESMTSVYNAGISGKISMVAMDIAANFDTSKTVATASEERYELYYYKMLRRTIYMQMDLSELRESLSSKFRQELLAVKNETQAMNLLNKYGTHLITGYNLGGRMNVTNYQTKSSASTGWASGFSLSEQIGVATTAASGGESFSMTQKYANEYNTATESSAYSFVSLGGQGVGALTIDQLFTYNPGFVDGKGNYTYERWVFSVNDGVNLDIVEIANGARAIPLWDLLPTGSEYNMIRRYLVSAYATKCGDKYAEYCEKYAPLYADITEEADTGNKDIDLEGFFGIKNDIVSTVDFENGQTSSDIALGTTVIMKYTTATDITDSVEWSIVTGKNYATVEDVRAGIFQITDNPSANNKAIRVEVKINDVVKDSWIFNIRDCLYTSGSGTSSDPYVIATVDDLLELTRTTYDWSKAFVLADNIDLSDVDMVGVSTIGTSDTPFTGTFDGNYCAISGFKSTNKQSEYLGLFGVVGNGGKISNLRLQDVYIENSYSAEERTTGGKSTVYAGALAGKNSGTITNCVVENPTVSIRYKYYKPDGEDAKKQDVKICCGGIVGWNSGEISECGVVNPRIVAEADVSEVSRDLSDNADNKDIIKDSSALCAVGGAIGYAKGGSYKYCYVKTVTLGDENAISTLQSYVVGETHKSEDSWLFGEKWESKTKSETYSGGFAGYSDGATLEECVVDVPDKIEAKRHIQHGGENLTADGSRAAAGTLIGYSGSATITLTKVFAHLTRQQTNGTYPEGVIAETKDGEGKGAIEQEDGKFKVLSGTIELRSSNLSSIASKQGKWCADKSGFPVLKSYELSSELFVDEESATTKYYYNQSFTPKDLNVSVIIGNGQTVAIPVYKIDYSRFQKSSINTIGYDITVSLGTHRKTYRVTVYPCEVEYISAKDVSTTALYGGDSYDKNGRDIQITAVLSNGEVIDPTDYNRPWYVSYPSDTFSVEAEELRVGANTIKLSYGQMSCEYYVNCEENKLLSIAIVTPPARTNYVTGETFDPTGMKVLATYEDGRVVEVNNDDLELIGTTISSGENSVVVTYGPYMTTPEPLKVYGSEATLSIVSLPAKTEYAVGETIDFGGMMLRYTYNGGEYEDVDASACTFSQYKITNVGANVVEVSYKSVSTTFILAGIDEATDPDPSAVTLAVDSIVAMSGAEFSVNVRIRNNPGISYLSVTPVYSDGLTLVKVENGELFGEMEKGHQYIWTSDEDVVDDGVLMTFTFSTPEGADSGIYNVNFIVRECVNFDEEAVNVRALGGTIKVISFVYGDANGDGAINGQDVVRLKKYLANYDYDTETSTVEISAGADANGDGAINGQDVVRLKKYLANFDYDTETSTVILGPAN